MFSFRLGAGPVTPGNSFSASSGRLGGGLLGRLIWVTNCCELFFCAEDGVGPNCAGPVSCYYQSTFQVPIKEGVTYRDWAIMSQ